MSPEKDPHPGRTTPSPAEDAGPFTIALEEIERSPCALACPVGIEVKAYVTLIAGGRYREALEVIRRRNPLPGICGRICTHPCEAVCNRGKVDSPVAIRDLKRFVSDWELSHPEEARPSRAERVFEEKVAIVGAGPAGLTAANDLVRMGYGVTVFEALARPGGMMITGIPPFRLPREILDVEIGAIEDLGVEIRLGTPVGPGLTVADLMSREGYSAVFLGIGAHRGRKLGIPGEEDALDAVQFLREANFAGAEKPGDRVLVIGGGNSAIDAARMSLRLGSGDVKIVYRRTREEMPADEGEIVEAEEEGIAIDMLVSPIEIVLERGRTVGLRVIRNKLGEPDESGRRRPVPIEGSETVIPCDRVIAAISQSPDLGFLGDGHGLDVTKWDTFSVDESTMATSVPGVFAGGDAWAGPASVIEAMRDGHKAATAIHCHLRGLPLPEAPARRERPGDIGVKLDLDFVEPRERKHLHHADPVTRRRSFDEVASGFTEEEAVAEASRCLHCGPCEECMFCLPVCDRKVFVSEDQEGNEEFVRFSMESPDYARATRTLEALVSAKLGEPAADVKAPVKLEPVTSFVMEKLCRGCGECNEVCEYGAAKLTEVDGRMVSAIDEQLCRGCGTCVAICPSGAIVARHFTDEWVENRLKAALLS